MFTRSAAFYDLIYSSFKDYHRETDILRELLQRVHPTAKTILDVACGTGEHARRLMDHGYQVDGLDLDQDLLDVAREKAPGGEFIRGDMIDFHLGKTYDVITCLFSSIGYVKSIQNLKKTLTCFKEHLTPNGVAIIEPWLTPDSWHAGKVDMKTAESEDVKICRMSYSDRQGNISKLRFEYLIGNAEGITREVEDHELGLFTVEEMNRCFYETGFRVDYDPDGIIGRGLYLARHGKEI